MRNRRKHLYRVTAYDQEGLVMFRRDYQSLDAAVARADRLLEGIDEPPATNAPDDNGYYREPAARVTIQQSELVQFVAEPEERKRGRE